MSRNKKIKTQDTERVERAKHETHESDHIIFSFKHLCRHSEYGSKYFKKRDLRSAYAALYPLFERLQELSHTDLEHANRLGKQRGCEHLNYSAFSKSVQQIFDEIPIVQKDSKLAVFRFGQNNYRMICKSDTHRVNLLYILAFDFDYSAYSH